MQKARSLFILFWMMFCCAVALAACVLRPFGVDTNVLAARLFSVVILRVARIRLRVEGAAKIAAALPAVIVANHQGALDIATYGHLFPRNTKIVGKKQLLWVPVFGLYLWLSGNVLIDRARGAKARATLEAAMARVRKIGASVWIFPEGTRNTREESLLPFKKGAFHMAIAAQMPILPMVSSSLKSVSSMERAYFHGGEVVVTVLDPIPTRGLTAADVDALSARVREAMLAELA